MGILEEISSLMQQGRAPKVKELVQQAIDEGVSPKEILEKGLLGAMSIIGDKFKKNEIFVPEVLIAARAMNAGVSILKPYLVEAGVESKGTAVIGTVKGDLHDIGKNLVKMMLEGKGLNVIDLGVDVPAEDFVKAAQENNADIICCSALLTTTMGEMKNVVAAAAAAGIRDKVKIMVGGAPITQSFCDSIGADCYSPDAASAADAALALCS
ncbi:MAG: cobalamin-binding protein [Clostridiales bacterium]|nr:cobalamin-binding protein [Clostridiales bacterium]